MPFTDKTLHGPAARADLAACEPCHATPFNAGPGGNPRYNIQKGNLALGCETCHQALTAHPNNQWLLRGGNTTTHLTAGNLNACKLCHGVNLDGAGGTGPSCVSGLCHGVIPLGAPACTSCHANPPATGKHSKHNGLANVTGVCATCHSGVGAGTATHANGAANVGISETYQTKTGGAAGYATNVCSNISCHGGQSINWLTGTINVNTECTKCHRSRTTSDQYNAYFSGEHGKHVSAGVFCYECHDTTKLVASHFSGLDTAAMSGAFQTIIPAVNYTGNGTVLGSCTINCHSVGANKTENHNSEGW
jgi:predicted CxxxxCH...CXXCH cytochrome family protein